MSSQRIEFFCLIDQYANTFLHDSSVQFRLRLHRAPLRHRPVKSNDLNSIPSTTFAAWILGKYHFYLNHFGENKRKFNYYRTMFRVYRVTFDEIIPNGASHSDKGYIRFFLISNKLKFRFQIFVVYPQCQSIGIIHRLLIYQKRSKCRLNYNWRSLWETIIHLLRFFSDTITDPIEKHIFQNLFFRQSVS